MRPEPQRSAAGVCTQSFAGRVLVHLRRCGVIVEYAAAMPTPANGAASVVVFLSKTPGQAEIARGAALRIPGVDRVTFSGFSRAVMYVYLAPSRRP